MDLAEAKKPKTIAELLPGLGGLLSKDDMRAIAHAATKKPRSTMASTRTSEKVLKPLTIAEMKSEIRSLQPQSPRKNVKTTASSKKKWNSSSKLENKIVSHTASGQMKNNPVRKVLNFQQPKPKAHKSIVNSRMTMMGSETPKFTKSVLKVTNTETTKFTKPETKIKKSFYLQTQNTVRISGICNIPETPVIINKPLMTRMTLANKENISNQPNIYKKLVATPKSTLRKRVMALHVPDTPITNESLKSSCDSSFLQNEHDIEYIENKTRALADEHTLDNIAVVSPPMSTPFVDYRNVKDFFNNSSDMMENIYHNNTIMCFDNTISKENSKREESVIVSLCDMLNRATVSSSEKNSTELHDLLEVKKQTESNLKMIDNGIKTLNNIKESQLKSLEYVSKLIQKKMCQRKAETKENTVAETKESPRQDNSRQLTPDVGPSKSGSVIKTTPKSPSYQIPKKYSCLRKKIICRSMPNICETVTPQKNMGEKALSMYLKMKEQNNYLNTPVVKQMPMEVPDTPAITSHNLQKQLDKLYNKS